ncbi:OmpA family protein [Bacteroidota bacterium]
MKSLIYILLIIFLFWTKTLSQNVYTNSLPNYSIYGGLNLNYHSAQFSKLKNIPNCCPNFETGFGNGLNFGIGYSYPLDEYLRLNLRLGYSVLDAELRKIEGTQVILNGDPQSGEFEHIINTEISNIGIEPTVSWKVYDQLSIFGGFRIALASNYYYDQYEKIIKPEGKATFIDSLGNDTHSVFRNKSDGDIPDVNSLQMFFQTGLSYDLPLNNDKSFVLSPEILLSLGITQLVDGIDWRANSLTFGVSIKYTQVPEPEIIEEYQRIEEIDTLEVESYYVAENILMQGRPIIENDTIEVDYRIKYIEKYYRTDTLLIPKDYKLSVDINAVGIDADGKEIQLPSLQVEEFLSTKMHPLLNYVFFDENSSDISDRYELLKNDETTKFRFNDLYNYSTLEVYYHILNVIGERMLEYPKAKLTLTGCNNNTNEEKGNKILSKDRAESVKEYLINIWKVPGRRIKIQSRNLPKQPSNNKKPEGLEENRRVEIYSNDLRIISPVVINDTLRTTNLIGKNGEIVKATEFKGIRFYPEVLPDIELLQLIILAENKIKTLKDYSMDGMTPEKLDWMLSSNKEAIEILKDTVFIAIKAKDKRNNIEEVKKPLGINRKTIISKKQNQEGDKKIDNYALILFEFGSMNLSKWNKDIPNLIRKNFEQNSTIKVTGYSDRVGDEDYNKKLSEKRAKTVAKALKHPNTRYLGVGEEKLLYNNDLPEGRFYCRTVDIIVETPIRW